MNVGTTPEADEKPALPVESQLSAVWRKSLI
jgi:hypothetical protein